jgi:diguanylate cyclase (GGDEF)-like protein
LGLDTGEENMLVALKEKRSFSMAQANKASSQRICRPILPMRPDDAVVKLTPPPRQRLHANLAFAGSCLLVVLLVLLDRLTGPYLDFGIFYLLPVMICAWWYNFPAALLIALAGTIAWNLVELSQQPRMTEVCSLWNGITRFGTLTLVASLVARLHSGIQRERRLARTDPLTGAANGRTFYERTETEAKRACRNRRPLTLVYIDLDNFKQLNDRLGHAAGDEALVHVVCVIHANLRQSDLLARLGGDEFALLLPETGPDAAVSQLTRLQGVLMQEMVRKNWPLSLSIGAVTFPRPDRGVDRMIQQVDGLMYAAKRKGKGRIEHQVETNGLSDPHARERKADRRVTARVLCNSSARIRCELEGQDREKFAIVRDISTGGVGLHLEERLPEDTVVVVESLSAGANTLLARVVHSERFDGRWLHGCVLSVRLSPEEILAWQGCGS